MQQPVPFERILLRTLAEHVPHRIYAKDIAGRFIFANHAVARGMGTAHPQELIGRTDRDFYPSESAAQYCDEEREIVSTGQPMIEREEHVHYSRSGTDAWMLTTKVPLCGDGGEVLGIAGINLDITERKAAEAELFKAKRQAEEATRAKSEFLATMSHELRTPLNAVLGYASILQGDAGLSAQQRSRLATIEHSGRHLLSVVNDLLDIAKIEAGRFELAQEHVDLRAVAQSVMDMVRVKATDKGLSCGCEVSATVPALVTVDGRRLSQVLLNLLGNAVKFTDSGEVRLRIGLAFPGPTPRLRFEVRDTGVGMREEERQRIFEAWEQAGDEVRRRDGAGLGLAISRQLVQAMGGTLYADSAPGIGSVFSFDLDVARGVLGRQALMNSSSEVAPSASGALCRRAYG